MFLRPEEQVLITPESDPLSHIHRHRARAYRQRARGSGGRVQSVRRPATRRSRIRDARGLAPRAMESVMN